MRMFLVGMCDIFLILYLTAITNVAPAAVLTVDDFYKLKSMHETLKTDQRKTVEEFRDKLRRSREEKEILMAEKKKQEDLAAARLKDLASEKDNLEAKLTEEKGRLEEMEQSLLHSDSEWDRVNKNLQEKEKMLKAREQLLASLNKEITVQQEAQREMEASYQTELNVQKEVVDASLELTKKLQSDTREARRMVNRLQEEARKEKEEAEIKVTEALAALKETEAQKEKALEAMNVEKAERKRAEQNARMLAATVKEIKQDGETAYKNNIHPMLQRVRVTYEREIADGVTRYERELSLMPVKIDKQIYGVFPSRQIGFSRRTDKVPDELVITYQDKRINSGMINKDDDLIAIFLSGYQGDVYTPYPLDTEIAEFMPTLLALRNNGSVAFLDKVRRISDSYFIVNRDYLKSDKDNRLKYAVPGFRGTGMRGERIVPGDQLVDLNGQLIGVASNTNRIIRINTMSEWVEMAF